MSAGLLPDPASPALSADGWCRIGGGTLASGGQYRPVFRFDSLEWRGAGLAAWADGALAPEAVELKLAGLRIGVQTGQPVMDYLLAAQAARNGIDGHLALSRDAAAKRLMLGDLSLDFPGDNAITASAQVDRIDLADMSAAQISFGGMALTHLALDVTSNGLFEGYLLMPLGNLLLSGDADPATEVGGMIRQGQAMISRLPGATFPGPARAALSALLAEMPNPAGRLELTVDAPGGFSAARLAGYAVSGAPAPLDALAPVFDGMTVDARYIPTPPDTK